MDQFRSRRFNAQCIPRRQLHLSPAYYRIALQISNRMTNQEIIFLRYRFKLPPLKVNYAPCLQQSIVTELSEIHLELQKLLVHKQVPSPRLVQQVVELVNRLETITLITAATTTTEELQQK